MKNDVLDNIVPQTFTVTVVKPIEKNIMDITEDDLSLLNHDGLIDLTKELLRYINKTDVPNIAYIDDDSAWAAKNSSSLITARMETEDHTGLLVKDVVGSDTANLKALSSSEMLQVMELGVPITFEVVGFIGKSILVKKDEIKYKISTPQNKSWNGVYLAVGDNIEVVVEYSFYSSKKHGKDTGKGNIQYQLNYIRHYTVSELPAPAPSPEYALAEIVEDAPISHDKPFKSFSRPKSFHTQNKWTPELRTALLRQVEKGTPLDQIYESSQKSKLPYTRCAIESQVRLMDYSIINGVPVKRIKKVQS